MYQWNYRMRGHVPKGQICYGGMWARVVLRHLGLGIRKIRLSRVESLQSILDSDTSTRIAVPTIGKVLKIVLKISLVTKRRCL